MPLSIYSLAFSSRPEAASDIMSSRFVRLIVPDNAVKLATLAFTVLVKFGLKSLEAAFLTVFVNDNCRK